LSAVLGSSDVTTAELGLGAPAVQS
jgi:hypothetical protein